MNLLRRNASEFCLLAVFIGVLPLLILQARYLWERPHFQFFPLAWIAVVWLVSQSIHLDWCSRQRVRASTLLSAVVVAGLVIGAWRVSPWIAHLSLILAVTAWGLARLPSVPWTRWFSWTLLLWVTLPLPLGYDIILVQHLQLLSSQSAGNLLDLLSVPNFRLGNLIEIRPKRLFVDEACSGVDSMYSLLAVALLITVWRRSAFFVGFIAIAAVPAWAWFGNVLRLTIIAVLLDRWNIDLSSGWQHTALGLVIFTGICACYLSTINVLHTLFRRFSVSDLPRDSQHGWHLAFNAAVSWPAKPPKPSDASDNYFRAEDNEKRSLNKGSTSAVDLTALSQIDGGGRAFWGLALLCLTAICAGAWSTKNLMSSDVLTSTDYTHFDKSHVDEIVVRESLPGEIGDAIQLGFTTQHRSFENFYGEYSAIWNYRLDDISVSLSLDFPFRGFHALWVCYENSGNSVSNTEIFDVKSAEISEWRLQRLELVDEFGAWSYVWFSLFDEQGRQLPMEAYAPSLQDRFRDRIDPGKATIFEMPATSYQFQLHVQSGEELSRKQQERLVDLYNASLPYAIERVKELVKNR